MRGISLEVMLSSSDDCELRIRGDKHYGRRFFGRERSSTIQPIPQKFCRAYGIWASYYVASGTGQAAGTQLGVPSRGRTHQ